jgi:hypothetical protein
MEVAQRVRERDQNRRDENGRSRLVAASALILVTELPGPRMSARGGKTGVLRFVPSANDRIGTGRSSLREKPTLARKADSG